MSAHRPEMTAGVVLRLARRPLEYQFVGDPMSAQAEDFKLATNDLEVAQGKKCGSLSVYDADITTPAKARALMTKPGKYRAVFRIDVAAIVGNGEFDLHVYRDPNPDGDMRPGAEGHCLLGNVWSAEPERMQTIRALLIKIAGVADDIV